MFSALHQGLHMATSTLRAGELRARRVSRLALKFKAMTPLLTPTVLHVSAEATTPCRLQARLQAIDGDKVYATGTAELS